MSILPFPRPPAYAPRCRRCAGPLETYDGEPFCSDCTAFRVVHLADGEPEVDLVDGAPAVLPSFPDDPEPAAYREWRRQADDAWNRAVLLAWAEATLPAPVLPCACTDATCLRCQAAAAVADPTGGL
jgi:hypothetical protein